MNNIEQEFQEKIAMISPEGIESLDETLTKDDIDTLALFNALFALSDEDFEILRPVFQDVIVESYSKPEAQLQLVQVLAQSGLSIDDMINNVDQIINVLNTDDIELSEAKKDFVKFMFNAASNALATSTINPAHMIHIPIEICQEGAKLPTYATNGSAAMDIYSPEEYIINPGETIIIKTGLKVAIPHGYALLIQPRSGMSARTKLRISNSPGLIDEDYHEEIGVIIENINPYVKEYGIITLEDGSIDSNNLYNSPITIGKGERFAQMRLVEVPKVVWTQVKSLGSFDQDHGAGFGSSGTK